MIGPLDLDAELADDDGGQQRRRHVAEGESCQFLRADPEPERQGEKHHELGVGAQRRDEPGPGGIEHGGLDASELVEDLLDLSSDRASASSASCRSTRDFAGLSSFDATVPSLSSSTSMLRRTMPSPTRRRPHDDDALGDRALDRVERRRGHVAVADAGDDEALRAVGDRGVDEIRRHAGVRVDDVDARQACRPSTVNGVAVVCARAGDRDELPVVEQAHADQARPPGTRTSARRSCGAW